jgi:hypothetical protein
MSDDPRPTAVSRTVYGKEGELVTLCERRNVFEGSEHCSSVEWTREPVPSTLLLSGRH